LSATKHLESLEGVTFSGMDMALQLEFKRARIDIKILGREEDSSGVAKFDLFERLNTYGTPLSPQELRNCILVSLSIKAYGWLEKLSSNDAFRSCTLLSDAQLLERYDMDLALRFLALRKANPRDVVDIHEYLREETYALAQSSESERRAGED